MPLQPGRDPEDVGTEGVGREKSLEPPWVAAQAVLLLGRDEGKLLGWVQPQQTWICASSLCCLLCGYFEQGYSDTPEPEGGPDPAQPRRGMNRLQGHLEQDPQESGHNTKPDRAQYVFEQPSQELGGILVIVQGQGLDLMTPVGCFQLRKFSNSVIPWFDLSLPIRTKTRLQIFRVNGRSPPDFRSLRTLHYFWVICSKQFWDEALRKRIL